MVRINRKRLDRTAFGPNAHPRAASRLNGEGHARLAWAGVRRFWIARDDNHRDSATRSDSGGNPDGEPHDTWENIHARTRHRLPVGNPDEERLTRAYARDVERDQLANSCRCGSSTERVVLIQAQD